MFIDKIKILSIIAIISIPASAMAAANKMKIGVIDSARVLQEYTAAQKMFKDLAKAEADLNKKILAKRQEIQKAKDAKKTDTELQMLAEQMRLEIEPEARKLEEKTNQQSEKIEDNIKTAIDGVAKSSKYDLVLLKEVVLYGGTDLTDDVLKKLK